MDNFWAKLLDVKWDEMFVPQTSLVEIFIRGTLMYLAMFVMLRLLRRGAGAIGITDLLVIVLIADAAQNAMAGDYKSITEGVLLVLTIIGWDLFLNWLGHTSDFFERLLRPSALILVKNGEMQRVNMRRELVTEEELMSNLRQNGVEDISEVKECYLEGDGNISVIKKQSGGDEEQGEKNSKNALAG